jgi:CheY-like chemotaxis protein
MDEATRSRIFEPFFTTKGLGHGTGLGLATVYGIVRQHEGMIQVSSEEGRGTEFQIYFPLVEARAANIPKSAPADSPKGKERLLLAEDEPAIRRLIGNLLRASGYEVTAVANGQEAMALLDVDEPPYDLVLLDAVMPGMGGPEVAKVGLQRHPNLPFIMLSGYAPTNTSLGKAGDGAKVKKWMTKPFSPNDLLIAVRETLDGE